MKKIIGIIVITIISFTSVWGQIDNLYFNKSIYQSTHQNPARQHRCRFTLALPVLSSTYIDTRHTGATYASMFTANKNNPNTFDYDVEKFYKGLSDQNYWFVHSNINLLSFSFWAKNLYVTFDSEVVVKQDMGYPKSFFKIKDGNYFKNNDFIGMSNYHEDFSAYASYGIGLSKEVAKGLVIGAKFKYLRGIANINTNKFNLDWHVSTKPEDTYDYTLKTEFEYTASTPFEIEFVRDEKGHITEVKADPKKYIDSLKDDPVELAKQALWQKNHGFGLDFGIIYNLNKKLEISASVLDLGFIKWQVNPLSAKTQQKDVVFSGLNVAKYANTLDDFMNFSANKDSILNVLKEDVIDTLFALTDPKIENGKEYKQSLNATVHGGLAYTLKDNITIGGLYTGYLYHNKLVSSYSLVATFMFWKGWSYTASYTFYNKSYNNIGMGLSANLGPLQAYVNMNNIAVPLFGARYLVYPDKPYNEGFATKLVKNMKWLNLQVGINVIMGCKEKTDFGLID